MTDKQKQWLAYAIVVAAILVAGFLGVTYPVPAPPVVVSSQGFNYPPGAIYFAAGGKSQVFQDGSSATFNSGASLTASHGSTVTLSGAAVFPVTTTINSVNPLLYSTQNYRFYAGSGTITGTLVLTSGQHGFTTLRWAECQVTQAPAAGEAAFVCKPLWTSSTVTFTNYTITPAVTTAAGTVTYMVFGTP